MHSIHAMIVTVFKENLHNYVAVEQREDHLTLNNYTIHTKLSNIELLFLSGSKLNQPSDQNLENQHYQKMRQITMKSVDEKTQQAYEVAESPQ